MTAMALKVETIQTDRLLFRGIDETDVKEIVLWRSDPTVYQYFKSPHKITVEEHINWYNNSYLHNDNRYDWICIEKESFKKIGVFGLTKQNDIAEVNYLLAPEAQHKGFAAEGIMRLVRYAAENLDVNNVIAEIHKDNRPSVAVVQKLGFNKISEDDDFAIYEIEVQ